MCYHGHRGPACCMIYVLSQTPLLCMQQLSVLSGCCLHLFLALSSLVGFHGHRHCTSQSFDSEVPCLHYLTGAGFHLKAHHELTEECGANDARREGDRKRRITAEQEEQKSQRHALQEVLRMSSGGAGASTSLHRANIGNNPREHEKAKTKRER